MSISHGTGHVTCDTDHLTPGDYSVMIAVEDTISGIRVSRFAHSLSSGAREKLVLQDSKIHVSSVRL